ncbi:lysozyme inhibitor LprI family protein [Pseudomonas aeruginosa]|uniref:lysozyme inhibitor LprI family protein n=1 Tax=Pseudomonas aeruginosa TaxID=287 RepID=UPI0021BD8CFA|nr:lysozyme inhibitor LprI family protein [Pseudomonas aeruginosa]
MRRSLIVTSIFMAISSASAFADDGYSVAYSACVSKAEGETSALVDCSNEELAKQDARLNKAYKTAMGVLSAENKQKLLDAQRLWVKFRDADCGVYYSLSGGTMDMLNGSGCELAMTKERAESLEWIAQNGAE